MAKDTTVSLGLDISAFRKSISEAITKAKSLAGLKPTVGIDVDDSELDEAGKKIDGLSKTVKVDVDTTGVDKATKGAGAKFSALSAGIGGALGGAATAAFTGLASNLKEGALAADEFGDSLEVAFKAQGVQDVDAAIEATSKSTLNLANDLGLPVARTRELAVSVASLGGFTGQSAEDLTKLSAGLETFTNGAVKGEAVAKAFARGINDPEGAAAIENLTKKYPQLAEVLKSNLSPAEKLKAANEQLGESFKTVAEQQSDVGGILNKLQNQFGEVFEKVGSQLLEALIPLAQTLLPIIESILPVVEGVLNPIAPIIAELAGAVGKIVGALSGPLMNLITAVIEPLSDLISDLVPIILQLVDVAMKPLTEIINIVADGVKQLFPAFKPVIDIILQLLPVVGDLVGRLLTAMVPVVKAVVTAVVGLVKALFENRSIMLLLTAVVNIAVAALTLLVGIFETVASVATNVIGIIQGVVEFVLKLVDAIARFDLSALKEAFLGAEEPAKKTAKATQQVAEATTAAAEAQKDLNAEQKKGGKTQDPEEAKKLAEALKKAAEQLAALNREQAKANALAQADLLGTEEQRAKKRLEIETQFQADALEVERKALTSKGKLRTAEEAVINKRLEILREDAARKAKEIEGKAAADRVKAAEEAEAKITEITLKVTEERVARLRDVLDAGGTAVAQELVTAQRALVEGLLSQTVDAIVASTPAFKAGAEKIGRELTAGLIDEAEARKRSAALRQTITSELLALPGDAADPFAAQIRSAYDKAAEAIAKGAAEVAAKIETAAGPRGGVQMFIDQLGTLQQVIADVDYAGPFNRAAEATRALTEEQEKLVEEVKRGEVSYQDAIARFTELEKERASQASATAEVVGAAFLAIAQSQLQAAQSATTAIAELNARNQAIADELVAIEERKNAAIASLREQDFQNAQLYEAAKSQIVTKADEDAKKLEAERVANSEKATAKQSEALAEIGAAAGSAFAGLLTGAQDSGQALKAVVGDTVKSLLLLYTPSIVALFSSIIPPPFGQIAGFAAVAALQALLASALSGFSEGGYTGNGGVGDVAGVVHGQEFVLNAKATRKNRALLEHLNAGGSVSTFAGAPVTELQMMRAELQAIRQRLDGMPNGIVGKQAVTVDVGFDAYLYERNQRRAAVRNLRG